MKYIHITSRDYLDWGGPQLPKRFDKRRFMVAITRIDWFHYERRHRAYLLRHLGRGRLSL